jgi:hypothetical protein
MFRGQRQQFLPSRGPSWKESTWALEMWRSGTRFVDFDWIAINMIRKKGKAL